MLGYLDGQLCARRFRVLIISDLPHSVDEFAVTRMLRGGKGQPQLRPVVDRQVERTLRLDRLIVPKGQLTIAAKTLARVIGDDVDESTGRITAKQRTLRSAQHLDSVHVVKRVIEHIRQVVIKPVKG